MQLDIIIKNNNKILITTSEELSAGYSHAANLKVNARNVTNRKLHTPSALVNEGGLQPAL